MFRSKPKKKAEGGAAHRDSGHKTTASLAAEGETAAAGSHYGKIDVGRSPASPTEPTPYASIEEIAEKRAVEAWMQTPIDRGEAQLCLQAAGLADGSYLVRKSSGGTYGLSIVSHKSIFHMKIMTESDPSGGGRRLFYIQGDVEYGKKHPSMWELLERYKTPTDRLTWHLVRCIDESYIPSKSQATTAEESAAGGDPHAAPQPPAAASVTASSATVSSAAAAPQSEPEYAVPSVLMQSAEKRAVRTWMQTPIDRGEAQLCLQAAGLADGSYLVRKSSGGTYGLSIVCHKSIFHMKIMTESDPSGGGRRLFYIQGDGEFGSKHPSMWELLVHYKTPTGRLTWHLVRCIDESYIPSKSP